MLGGMLIEYKSFAIGIAISKMGSGANPAPEPDLVEVPSAKSQLRKARNMLILIINDPSSRTEGNATRSNDATEESGEAIRTIADEQARNPDDSADEHVRMYQNFWGACDRLFCE